MKILIYSPAFFPSVGGLELMAKMLAEDFTSLGHQVTLITSTPDAAETQFDYEVVRRPGPIKLLRLYARVDVVLYMNVSLKGLWPFIFVQRPWVAAHFGQYRRNNGRLGVRDHLKYQASNFAANISCSEAILGDLPGDTVVVGNAYQDNLFRRLSGDRDRDLVFVGRLVSEKGVDLILQSLIELRAEGLTPTLTIVGFGPEEKILQAFCRDMHLQDQVEFSGKQTGVDLVELVNKHKIIVVPSRNEGFGIVALEGIACGCAVVGSDAGGLPEAIGDCGIIFQSGSSAALTSALKRMLTDSEQLSRALAQREAHLTRFTRREVAKQYLAVIERTARSA